MSYPRQPLVLKSTDGRTTTVLRRHDTYRLRDCEAVKGGRPVPQLCEHLTSPMPKDIMHQLPGVMIRSGSLAKSRAVNPTRVRQLLLTAQRTEQVFHQMIRSRQITVDRPTE